MRATRHSLLKGSHEKRSNLFRILLLMDEHLERRSSLGCIWKCPHLSPFCKSMNRTPNSRYKGTSSRYLRQEFPQLKRRLPSLWTNSYFVATTGGVTLETLERYVEGQKNR